VLPYNLKNSHQKALRDIGSLSLTINFGIPCNQTTLTMNSSPTFFTEYGWATTVNYTYLVNLSTATMIEFFLAEFGSPSMKSKEITFHTDGTGNGCSKPVGNHEPLLFHWQMLHSAT
jgi:hypothetical protein